MDPSGTPAPADPLPYSGASALADADPFWAQRVYLGLGGIAISQLLELAELAMTVLVFLAARSEFWGTENLFYLLPSVHAISFAVIWSSAVFLVAAPEPGRDGDAAMVPLRKLLIVLGCAALLLASFSGATYPLFGISIGKILPFVNVGAHTALLVYLLRLADRAQDAYLKKHLPMVLALVVLSSAIGIAGRFGFRRAMELHPALNIAAAVYFLHVVVRLRKIIAVPVHAATSRGFEVGAIDQPPMR